MKRTALLLFVCNLVISTVAQERLKELSLRDAITRAGTEFRPEHLPGLQWIPGTSQYAYVKDQTLLRGGTGKMAELPVVTLAALNTGLPEDGKLKGIPSITWTHANEFHFLHNGKLYTYDLTNNKLSAQVDLPAEAEREDVSADARQVAFTMGEHLYIARAGAKAPIAVTSGGSEGIVHGRSVHREEYGITKGTFWSPDGGKLAFYRMDESMVTPYMLEDISTQPSSFKKIRYPMAGQASHHVSVGVYDVAKGTTIYLQAAGALDDYLTNIAWDPSGTHLYIIHLNRATNVQRLVRYDANTGEVLKTLVQEEDAKWLEPQHPVTFLRTAPSRYIHWSQQDGYWHLYLYDLEKGLVRQLTKGPWVVKRLVALDEKERFALVEGTDMIDPKDPKGALETHLYRVDLAKGTTTKLTREPGTHHGELSSDGRFLIDAWSSTSVPGRTEIRDAATGSLVRKLVDSKDPLATVSVGTIELFTVEGEQGDRLNARLIKPKNMDSRKRYPVLVYLYNGPHVQLVTNSFLGGASLWMLHAAERGYLVFTVDGHGSENRGKAFEQAIHRQLGITEVKDQLRGVEHLKRLPYVDSTRMAVHGWSYGGHMTTALLLRSPGTFKAAVAGGPVMDWSLYEVMYTERYMDTPSENPEGYALTRHTDKAASLRDDLLVITGGMDDTVLPEHSYAFLKNCVDTGIQVDFFAYPGHGHNVRGKDRVHLYTKVLDYIDERLGVGR